MSTSATPYEIRLELLRLARTILETQAQTYDANGRSIPGRIETADVIASAREMQGFVDDNGKPPRVGVYPLVNPPSRKRHTPYD